MTGPSSSRLDRANASTEIRLWARTRNAADRSAVYVRMTPDALLANLQTKVIDGALVQRNVIPATMVTPLLEAMRATGQRYVLDLDDDLLDVPEDKDPDGRYRAYTPMLRQLIESAGLVTVSTEALAERIQGLNQNTCLLPNRLDEALWRGSRSSPKIALGQTGLYMGSRTHGADFDMIAPALTAVAARNPDFRLKIVGVHDQHLPDWAERIRIPDDAKSYHRFVPWLRELAADADFSLAPLVDTPFNRLKSSLKLLDSLALGLPVIASDVTPYHDAVKEGLNGVTLVTNTMAQWESAIEAHLHGAPATADERDRLRRTVLDRAGMEVIIPKISGAQT